MKKFIMITPSFQDSMIPLMALVEKNVIDGEEIRLITVTPFESAKAHEYQLRDKLASLQEEKGFICRGIEAVPISYNGAAETSIEIFRNLLPYFDRGDELYVCLSYGSTPMAIAELMAIKYAYHVLDDVIIKAVVYGSSDITSLIRLDEIACTVAMVGHPSDPIKYINRVLEVAFE